MKFVEYLAASLFFFLVAIYALHLSVSQPKHNWDMIMYIAAAKSFEEPETKPLHAFTYDQLRSSVSKEKFKELVQGNYRSAISTDSSAFEEQLPFYQIRPLYNGTIYLLYKAGVDIVFSTHIISGTSVVLALTLLYIMSTSFLGRPLIYAVPLTALIFGVLEIATLSTPDGMAFFAITLASYLYLSKRTLSLLIFFPIMLCVRTDLILFIAPLLFFIFIYEKSLYWEITLSILVSIIVYISIGAYWENPGWSTIIYFSLVEYLTHPISMPPNLTAHHFLSALFYNTKGLLYNKAFLLFGLASLSSIYLILSRMRTKTFLNTINATPTILSMVCTFYVISHFLAFPTALDRFFIGPYIIGSFSLLFMLNEKIKPSR